MIYSGLMIINDYNTSYICEGQCCSQDQKVRDQDRDQDQLVRDRDRDQGQLVRDRDQDQDQLVRDRDQDQDQAIIIPPCYLRHYTLL